MATTTKLLRAVVWLFLTAQVLGFSISPASSSKIVISTTQVNMGMFDFIQNAFKNEEYDDRRATASHILVDTEEEALVVQKAIIEGTTFAEAAQSYSKCPSSKKGGSLGTFEPGTMVKEFDDVVFNEDTAIGEVVGPIPTQFGYHLIKVENRFENEVKSDGSGFL
mmetsp:Transcript_35124/g.49892  ORF Transcript_35124/g.49892 Transcript_35124/m.49892 type:complete len:165 (-) Transcript_35124:198-692(-)